MRWRCANTWRSRMQRGVREAYTNTGFHSAQYRFIADCICNKLSRAEELSQHNNVDVDAGETIWFSPAICETSALGQLDTVRWLVERKGASVHVLGHDGRTALFRASGRGHLKCVQYLFDRGADPHVFNKRGATPFMAACRNGHVDMCRWFAEVVGVGDAICSISKDVLSEWSAIREWQAAFLQRRLLIAYWGAGRERARAGAALASSSEGRLWAALPRQPMANVILWLRR